MFLNTEMSEEAAREQPWIWNRLKYTSEAFTAATAAADEEQTAEQIKLESLLHNTWPLQQLIDEAEDPNDITNHQLRLSSGSGSSSSSSKSSSRRKQEDDDSNDSASQGTLAWHLLLKPIPQKKYFRALTHLPVFRYPSSNGVQQEQQHQHQHYRQLSQPPILPLVGPSAAMSKLQDESAVILRKLLRQAARKQSKKRSPNCMRKCIAQGLLHPAQCHSLC